MLSSICSFREVLQEAENKNPSVFKKKPCAQEQKRKEILEKKEQEDKISKKQTVIHLSVDEKARKETWWRFDHKYSSVSIAEELEEYEEMHLYEEKGALFKKAVPCFKTTWQVKRQHIRGKRKAYPVCVLIQFYSYLNQDNGQHMNIIADHLDNLVKDKEHIQKHNYKSSRVPKLTGITDMLYTHVMFRGYLYRLSYHGLNAILDNPDSPAHKMQIEISEIPLKYRYRVDTVLFIPNFIKPILEE